jgi:RNA polymerase sigma-70 factor, ECF subfamily
LALGIGRGAYVATFLRLRTRPLVRWKGVKEWTASQPQGAPRALAARADELGVGRTAVFHRRGTPVLSPEDEQLTARAVREAKRGGTDGVRFLYARYADHVYSYLRTVVRDDHEAEDLTQHVFAKLISAIHRYEPQGAPFSRWLLRLAHNAAVDHLRAARSVPVEEVMGAHESIEDGVGDRARVLTAALARVPDDQREVLVLRHIAGLSPDEIADRLGRTTSSVHSLHHRGRGTLRAALHELGAAPLTLHRAA